MDILIEKFSCRLCLNTKCDEKVSFVENKSLLALYQFCVGVVVDLNTPPLSVCNDCVDKIDNFAKFKEKCKKSEDFWKNILNNKSTHRNEDQLKTENSANDGCTELYLADITKYDEICNNNYSTIEINSTKEIKTGSKTSFKSKQRGLKCDICKRQYKYSKCLINHKCTRKKSSGHEKNKNSKFINQGIDDREIQELKYAIGENNKEELEKRGDNRCGLCDFFVHNKTQLIEHLNEHFVNNLLKCKICGYDGPDFAKMISHRYNHVRQHFWCHICDRRMRSVMGLDYHFRSEHLHKPGQCVYCSSVSKTYHSWRKHERLHTDKRQFICDLCDKRFLYKNQIVAHMIDHSDIRDFICETCGRSFKRLSSLKSHIGSVHEKYTSVICDHCNRRFKNKDRLDQHLKNLSEYKPYQCPVCSKRYRLECYLNYHMFWHTEERPYSCEICGSKYKGKAHLKVHMRKHTGERPHKCSVCGKQFVTSHQAKRHMSVHTGVPQNLTCESCKKTFRSLKALREHSVQHTLIEIKDSALNNQ